MIPCALAKQDVCVWSSSESRGILAPQNHALEQNPNHLPRPLRSSGAFARRPLNCTVPATKLAPKANPITPSHHADRAAFALDTHPTQQILLRHARPLDDFPRHFLDPKTFISTRLLRHLCVERFFHCVQGGRPRTILKQKLRLRHTQRTPMNISAARAACGLKTAIVECGRESKTHCWGQALSNLLIAMLHAHAHIHTQHTHTYTHTHTHTQTHARTHTHKYSHRPNTEEILLYF